MTLPVKNGVVLRPLVCCQAPIFGHQLASATLQRESAASHIRSLIWLRLPIMALHSGLQPSAVVHSLPDVPSVCCCLHLM